MFTGAMVALITPFQDDEIDFQTLDELINFQLENGVDAIVPVGTTGESPTLSHEEHKKLIERVVKTVSSQIPVIAGAGSNSTAEAIELAAFAKEKGEAKGLRLLLVLPNAEDLFPAKQTALSQDSVKALKLLQNYGIGFVTTTKSTLGIDSQLAGLAEAKAGIVHENDAAVQLRGKKNYRVLLRPGLSEDSELEK